MKGTRAEQLAEKAFERWLKSQQKELARKVSYLLDRDKITSIARGVLK